MIPQQFDSLALKVLKVIGQRAQLEPWVCAELRKTEYFAFITTFFAMFTIVS